MNPVFAPPARADRSFERLYRRHAADVYRYAYAVLQNRADAEDVTQTTFMNAYRALERGERPERPHNWLIAITHNVCRQRFRQSQRRPSEVEWQEDLPDQLVADDEGPSADDIRRALGHLPFNQRAALVMRELEGRSYAEIAAMLDVTTAAVETLIFRARRALREQLEGSLTCGEAELAISKQLDGRLTRAEKGQLRAHLRECPECATFARRQRAQRTALKSLGAIPLPASLASFFGGGGAPVGVVAAKAVAVAAAAALAGGAGYEAAQSARHSQPHRGAAALPAPSRPATVAALVPVVRAPHAEASEAAKPERRSSAPVRHGHRRGEAHGRARETRHDHGRGRGDTKRHGDRPPDAVTANEQQPRAVHGHGAPAHADRQTGAASHGESRRDGASRHRGAEHGTARGSSGPAAGSSGTAAHGNDGSHGHRNHSQAPAPSAPSPSEQAPPAHGHANESPPSGGSSSQGPPGQGQPPGKRGASFSP